MCARKEIQIENHPLPGVYLRALSWCPLHGKPRQPLTLWNSSSPTESGVRSTTYLRMWVITQRPFRLSYEFFFLFFLFGLLRCIDNALLVILETPH
ncbi:hypothetical protein BDV34DRAFT_38712 [Aspergillus parasiticus]|uniref:Uncharacterized protein n=1 Tax=Aspergillus parasiticus TaxID=5067 RepID=A0A5N6DXM7_ASPPA|nr:hypothetical protein BDV34DRAFT_38712 [Aspergillus parasiticus]